MALVVTVLVLMVLRQYFGPRDLPSRRRGPPKVHGRGVLARSGAGDERFRNISPRINKNHIQMSS